MDYVSYHGCEHFGSETYSFVQRDASSIRNSFFRIRMLKPYHDANLNQHRACNTIRKSDMQSESAPKKSRKQSKTTLPLMPLREPPIVSDPGSPWNSRCMQLREEFCRWTPLGQISFFEGHLRSKNLSAGHLHLSGFYLFDKFETTTNRHGSAKERST